MQAVLQKDQGRDVIIRGPYFHRELNLITYQGAFHRELNLITYWEPFTGN